MSEKVGNFIKYDVSKLSGKKDGLPKSVVERAVLGSDNEGIYRRQISKIVSEIEDGKMFDLSLSENNRSTQAINILKNNFNVTSLRDLRNGQQDTGKSEYVRENLKKSEERLAKATLISLKKSGVEESDLVSPEKIDEKLPDELRGLGETISSFIITDSKIKEQLAVVELYRNGFQIDDYGEKKDLVLTQIEMASREIRKSLNSKNIKQIELASNYLNSLKKEVSRNREKEDITDEIVTFLDDHVIRRDVTVDEDLNLKNLHGGDDFAKDKNGEYIHQETIKWIKEREQKATDLIMICSGGEFSSIGEISKKLNEGGLLSPYYTREDGTRGEKEYLKGLKDTLGFCVYETIQDSGVEANQKILGTLNTNRVDRLIPMVMGDSVDVDATTKEVVTMQGLSDDIVINAAQDPFLREQLKTICLIDRDKKFSLMAINGGFSSLETKEQLKKDITIIVSKIIGSPKMGSDKSYTDEASRIRDWLNERNQIYQNLMDRQEKLGRGGNEFIPEGPEYSKEREKIARFLLDTIEASGSAPGSLNIMDQCTKLFNMTQSQFVEVELKTEIKARLSLAFLYYHMHAAGGLLNNRGQSIEDSFEQAHKEGLELDYGAIKFFLKDGANKIKTAEFWNEFEEINFGDKYFKTLTEMMGVTPVPGEKDTKGNIKYKYVYSNLLVKDNKAAEFLLSLKGGEEVNNLFVVETKRMEDEDYLKLWTNDVREKFIGESYKLQNWRSKFWGKNADEPMYNNYFIDGDMVRKEIVNKFLIKRVKEKTGEENDYFLEKGLELALKLLDSTGESSAFNACFAGHNDFSELCLSEANTKDRQDKMKTYGSLAVMDQIVSFATTWMRYVSGGKEDKEVMSVFGPLLAEKIFIERLRMPKNDGYTFYTAVIGKKCIPAQSFFMSETVPKEALTFEFWKKVADPLSKVAGYGQDVLTEDGVVNKKISFSTKDERELGVKRLNKLAVQSIVGLATRYDCDWTFSHFKKLHNIVTKEIMGKDGGVIQFISEDDWKSIFDASIYKAIDDKIKKLGLASENDEEITKFLARFKYGR